MVALIGLGLDAIFARFPQLMPVMRWAGRGVSALARLADRAIPDRCARAPLQGRPLGFFGATAFQWINPKGWVMAISALTAYSVTDDYTISVARSRADVPGDWLALAAAPGWCSGRPCARRCAIPASRARSI